MSTGSDTLSDEQAMGRFCAEAYPRLVGVLSHECGDVHLAEEFAQEALVRACQQWEKVSQLDAPIGWCFRVGVNLSRSWFRRRAVARRARQHVHAVERHHDVDVASQIMVRHALGELTAPQREAVLLRYFLDLSVEETARLLDSSEGAIRGLTHRAVQRLRGALDVEVPSVTKESADGR